MKSTRTNLRYATLLVALTASLSMNAQLVQDNEQALVYYMPKTELVFDIHYDETIRTAGIYAQYADLLGIHDPITKTDTTYIIRDVHVSTRATADTDRAYKVVAANELNTQLIALSREGILTGYNISVAGSSPVTASAQHGKSAVVTEFSTPLVIPFMESDMKVDDDEARAEKVAEQIFQIRETRMFILAGEVDHYPTDGKAMEEVLATLEQQEHFLVSLFSGTVQVNHLTKSFTYCPTHSEEVVLANFNNETGFGEGESLMLTIAATKQVKSASTEPVNKKAPQPSQIYYNLPGTARYSLIFSDKLLAEGEDKMAQLGVAIPLTKDLFKENIHIIFDTETGNIVSIYR